ncbi:MAG: hypothetical protein E6J83_00170 [Deltaproteobacteria bacterium]|nr:MAG: hypothetical protein E6J83_00170 [Deltaproteobacteria bacterium]
MPVFRKRRARAGGSPAEAPKPVRPRPPALVERLARIAAETAPEEALEPALQAVLEESGVHAGALCLFDPRQGVLRLAAESGLSDEGCRRLRTVRRGDPATWDMPLHGLMNGRAYLIESAARNRYVPRLIEAAASVRTVACVPLNAGPAPVGSLILVAVAPRSLGERDIRALEPVLGDLARMIEATRRRPRGTETPAGSPATSAATAGLVAVRDRLLAEHERLAAELEGARRVADQVTPLTVALAEAERARARLAEALGAAATERSEQARGVATLEAARTEAQQLSEAARAELASARQTAAEAAAAAAASLAEQRRQVERLEARLADAEAAAARRVEAARERERAHERAVEELRTTLAHEQRLREEREAAARGASDGRAELERAHAAADEAARAHAAANAAAEGARAQLAQTTHVIEALEDEAARAQSEILRLEAELTGATSERTRLEDALAEARARVDEARERDGRHEREIARLRRELDHTAAVGRERVAESAGLGAQLEGLAAERDRVRETVAGLEAERDRLAAEAAARGGLDEALARERAERGRLAGALAEAEAARGALEAAHARQATEAAARLAALERELERPVSERTPVETQVDEARGEADGAPMQVVTVGAAPGGRPRPGSARLRVVVLDGDAAWESAGTAGNDIVVLAPGENLAARVTEIAPARVVVNLAARGALAALQSLRASGCTASFWGCVAAPAADRGVALGTIEASRCPLDPEAIVATLGSHVGRGTPVLTAGTDVDALMSLRQALARLGASVSMAWDGKQAADLLAVVQPEVVVVDLGLTRRDGYLITARLGGLEAAPHAVLVECADDTAEAFAATLADPGVAGRTKPLDRMLAELLTRREPEPAQQRRPKIRAVGLTRK